MEKLTVAKVSLAGKERGRKITLYLLPLYLKKKERKKEQKKTGEKALPWMTMLLAKAFGHHVLPFYDIQDIQKGRACLLEHKNGLPDCLCAQGVVLMGLLHCRHVHKHFMGCRHVHWSSTGVGNVAGKRKISRAWDTRSLLVNSSPSETMKHIEVQNWKLVSITVNPSYYHYYWYDWPILHYNF